MFEDKEVIKILAIDGGGIRGIVPAIITAEIEKKTGKRISDLFDFIAGTSTGALLSILLNKKNPLSASSLLPIYEKFGGAVFSPRKTPVLKFHKTIKDIIKTSVDNLNGAKYSTKGMDAVLEFVLGNSKLCDTIKPLLLTSYETTERKSVMFRNYEEDYLDIKLKDAARAVSAAPTYFEPVEIEGCGTFIDGGIGAANPAMCAYSEVVRLLREKGANPFDKKIVVVSIGTGAPTMPYVKNTLQNLSSVEWVEGPLMPFFFGANISFTEQQLENMLPTGSYFRFQIELKNTSDADEMDNISKENVQELKQRTCEYIRNNKELDRLCSILVAQSVGV